MDRDLSADRQAITNLIHLYCRAVDRLDVPLGHSIWHDDGYADYGEVYQGDGRGVIDLICAQHLHTLHHVHQVSNIVIDLDGDRAGSEAYVAANLRMQRGESLQQMSIWGRYVDSWSRRDGRWGLEKRIAIRDFDEIREVTEMHRHDMGRRDRSDPSYMVLKSPDGGARSLIGECVGLPGLLSQIVSAVGFARIVMADIAWSPSSSTSSSRRTSV